MSPISQVYLVLKCGIKDKHLVSVAQYVYLIYFLKIYVVRFQKPFAPDLNMQSLF